MKLYQYFNHQLASENNVAPPPLLALQFGAKGPSSYDAADAVFFLESGKYHTKGRQ